MVARRGSCVGASAGCCARHTRALGCEPLPSQHTGVRLVFASKHPDRGAALVRGTQIADGWPFALMLGGADIRSACARLFGRQSGHTCAQRSQSLLVVHLKDLSPSLFKQLPRAVHVLDPIDKIYRGWDVPKDMRLCGLVTHSAAQARLYQSKGAGTAWVVPDHGLAGCTSSASPHRGAPQPSLHDVFSRRTVMVLGGSPSAQLRRALGEWTARTNRRVSSATAQVRVLFEKDLRSSITFSQSHGWSGWLCSMLQHNASLAVAWDQISGLPFQDDCLRHMGLTKNNCFALKPAERFIVPLSSGVPTIGFRYPSFAEATRVGTLNSGAAETLLVDNLEVLVERLTRLTTDYESWRRSRQLGDGIGAAHGISNVRAAYQRTWSSVMSLNGSCARTHTIYDMSKSKS